MFPRKGEHPQGRGCLPLAGFAVLFALLISARPGAAAPPRDDDDPVIVYLQRHNLTDLVIARLEARFEEALGEDRIPLAERLAVLYGRMLDETDDDAQRAEWERRSRDMLDQVPPANTEVLRLTIHKASYLRAERIAELHRLRRATDVERATAVRLMGEVAAAMSQNFIAFREQIRRKEGADIGKDTDAAEVEAQLQDLDSKAMQAAYYGGWARYYQAWLTGSAAGLDEAAMMFAYLLQSQDALPQPEDISEGMLSNELAARAAIGIALCQAQAGRASSGLAWIDAVQAAAPKSEHLQSILRGYRLVILFAARQWGEIEQEIAAWRADGSLTTTLVRLYAVLALDQSQSTGDPEARRLGEQAVNLLAEMGELLQVIEIANVFRLDTLGGDSFILAYVPAIKAYEAAREQHGSSEEPATDAKVIALYAQAEKQLADTAARRDAGKWPQAARHAQLLVAWAQYFQNQLGQAATHFEQISTQLTGDESEGAMWMSIVCRERLASGDPNPEAAASLQKALHAFLDRFPSSSRAGRVRFRLATSHSAVPTLDAVDELLAIPPGSDTYAAARNEAERLLYLLLREAPADQRIQTAARYLGVALPLLESDERRAFLGGGDTSARDQYLLRARRVLDVLLTRGVARVSDARRILDRLETARAAGLMDLKDVSGELDYRRFQAQILSGGFDEAAQWCDELWKSDPQSAFAQSASRALYAYAVQDWQTFADDTRLEQTLRRVVLHGRRALRSAGDPPSPAESANAAIMINVADAAQMLDAMTKGGDAELRTLSEAWFGLLLAAQPRDFRVLRGSALIAERRGNADEALGHWRLAMNGSPEATAQWFEAKYHFIRLLSAAESARAREVMDQHVLLYPDYGPAPWGDKLRALHEQMKQARGDP